MKNIALSMLALLTFATGSISTKAPQPHSNLFDLVNTGNRSLVKKALKRGVNLNALNAQGKTALDVAIEHGYNKIARDIASNGGRVTTERNSAILTKIYTKRAFRFLIACLFVPIVPFLWIGTLVSLGKASNDYMLIKD